MATGDHVAAAAECGGALPSRVAQSCVPHPDESRVWHTRPRATQVKRGVLYTWHEAEGKRLRNPFDTVTEGVGLNRLTTNFDAAHIDDAVQVTDREAVEMAAYLLRCVCVCVRARACVCACVLLACVAWAMSVRQPSVMPCMPCAASLQRLHGVR
jgi:cysteine synthase